MAAAGFSSGAPPVKGLACYPAVSHSWATWGAPATPTGAPEAATALRSTPFPRPAPGTQLAPASQWVRFIASSGRTMTTTTIRWLCAVAVAGIAVAGCATVGPDYVAPEPGVPSAWQAELAPGLSAAPEEPKALGRWWATLDDPMLTRLVERAVAGNLELKQAQARVREARARRRQTEAGYFPGLDASGSVTRQRGSEETGAGVTRTLYTAGFDAS